MKTVLGALRHSGRPLAPEHSVLLRVAAAGAVCTGMAGCTLQGLVSPWIAGPALALVAGGAMWSYHRRARPVPYLRALLAVLMIGAFAWFFATVSADAPAGQLGAVESAMAVLFTSMQAVHSFDLPTRRDLGFAIAGSATLVALASTQAVSLSFGVVVAVWATCVVLGLTSAWASMAGGARIHVGVVVPAVLAAVAIAVAIVVVLPPPAPPTFAPTTISGDQSQPAGEQPSRMVPGPAAAARQSASAAGPTGVGGYLGFAGPLDTALRSSLGNEVVLRVRADRPSYWLAETFDTWSGESWTESGRALRKAERSSSGPAAAYGADGTRWETVAGGPPLVVRPPSVADPPGVAPRTQETGTPGSAIPGGAGSGTGAGAPPSASDYQTFYLAGGGSDLVLHASQAMAVWFPASRLYVGADGTIESAQTLGAGSVYTVLSTVETPTPAQLRSASGEQGLTAGVREEDLELPHPYPRVAALARRITAGQGSVYGDVTALEQWIGAHTTYTTDIPPLGAGQDTVDQFLFGSRRGYCEQISTALAVMLRTLGIPSREAVGYVPGPYDPLTGTYDVEAKDAHAWVQVWFPGYGWQSFDPTAYVPDATPSSAGSLQTAILGAAERIPLVPTLSILALLVCAAALVRRYRLRPVTWRAAVSREIERAARAVGTPPQPADTLSALAGRIDAAAGPRASSGAMAIAWVTEEAAWRGEDPDRETVRRLVREARRLRRRSVVDRARRAMVRRPVSRGARRPPRRSWRRQPATDGRPSTGEAD